MDDSAKGKSALERIDQSIGVEDDENVILESQPFIPTPSNEIEVRDVPITKLIVTTLGEGKNTSLTPKDAFRICSVLLIKATSHKHSLRTNANYLVEVIINL